jgi:integrase
VQREHITFTADGMKLLVPRAKSDQAGQGADCRYGPVFRKVDRWGTVEFTALHPYALPKILARRAALAKLSSSGLERLSAHGLRAGFITEAYKAGARDEAIMAHSRHKDVRTMRGYVRRAKLVAESPAGLVGL